MNLDMFKKLTKKQRINILFGIAGLLGGVCFLIIAMNLRGITVNAPEVQTNTNNPLAIAYRDPFTGKALTEASSGSRVACVMVENSADAWPLSGVEEAFLVIEAPVEGSIPRFMACFSEGEHGEKIGPVRSARPYYVAWASGLGAMYAHVGGSPDALDMLARSTYVTDLNEFWNGASFWRDTDRFAPHNAYTSTALLFAAATRLEMPLAKSPEWMYEESQYEQGKQPCDHVVIHWGSASAYNVTWECEESTGKYIRAQGGVIAKSDSGNTYTASNVIILEAQITSIDAVDRKEIVTEGMGNAKICSQGFCHNGLWHKEGVDKPLQFFTSYPDEPFVFVPGKTWIEVVEDIDAVTTEAVSL